jgi:hypothetical protein
MTACIYFTVYTHAATSGQLISVKDYVRVMFTHRARACVRTCARACVIKHSLIYRPILFKCAVNILQITASSMGYLLFMFTHRAHAWLKHSLIFGRILLKFAGHIMVTFVLIQQFRGPSNRTDSKLFLNYTLTNKYIDVLHPNHVHASRARICERARD